MKTETRGADVGADAWHAGFAAADAAAPDVDDVANVAAAPAAKMTSRPLRGRVYTCDK